MLLAAGAPIAHGKAAVAARCDFDVMARIRTVEIRDVLACCVMRRAALIGIMQLPQRFKSRELDARYRLRGSSRLSSRHCP